MEVLKPIVDLPLEEITNGKTPDSSANKVDVVLSENTQIIPDDQFGSCLLLAGKDAQLSYELPDVTSGKVSFSFWYKGSQTNQVLASFDDATGKAIFQIITNEKGLVGLEAEGEKTVSEANINNGQWNFLAVVVTKEELSLYVNSVLSGNLKTAIATSAIKKFQLNGACSLAHSKAYDGAISQKAILDEQKTGATAGHIFKTTYPLDFEFIDDEVKNAFYIVNLDQGQDQTVQWQAQNTSTQQIIFTALEEASAQSFHFEIRFRPQTFKDNNISVSRLDDDWIASDATLNSNNTVSVFLSYTGKNGYTLAPDAIIDFGLSYRSAFGQLGGRGTHTLITYQNLHYPDNKAFINGSRVKQVDIVNQRGKKNIPLHIGFIGSNTILNDADPGSLQGTKNNLRFRLINAMNDSPLTFNSTKNTPDPAKQTRLTLSFDSMEERRLASDNELQGIKVRTAGNWATVTQKNQGKMPIFIIDAFTVDALPAATALDILIENIITSQPSGNTSLYINYQNMPGYWDGEIILEVEKTPIIHRNLGNGKHVGIGVEPSQEYQLKVGGNVRIEPDNDDEKAISVGSKDNNTVFELKKHGSLNIGDQLIVNRGGVKGLTSSFPVQIQGDQLGNQIFLGNHENTIQGWLFAGRGGEADTPESIQNDLVFSFKDKQDQWNEALKLHPEIRPRDKSGFIMPVGTILPFAAHRCPEGFLYCNGAEISEEQYPELFEVLGDTWTWLQDDKENWYQGRLENGNVRLPDLRGYFLRGANDWANGRDEYHERQTGHYQWWSPGPHEHETDTTGEHFHNYNDPNIGGWKGMAHDGSGTAAEYPDPNKGVTTNSGSHKHKVLSNGGKETRPINASVYYIIKC